MREMILEDLIQDEEVLQKLKSAASNEEFKALFEAHTVKQQMLGKMELSDEELDTVAGGIKKGFLDNKCQLIPTGVVDSQGTHCEIVCEYD